MRPRSRDVRRSRLQAERHRFDHLTVQPDLDDLDDDIGPGRLNLEALSAADHNNTNGAPYV